MKGIDITKKVTNAEKAIFSEKALAAKKRRCTRVSMNIIDNNLIATSVSKFVSLMKVAPRILKP